MVGGEMGGRETQERICVKYAINKKLNRYQSTKTIEITSTSLQSGLSFTPENPDSSPFTKLCSATTYFPPGVI
jgi:hypothetical protein